MTRNKKEQLSRLENSTQHTDKESRFPAEVFKKMLKDRASYNAFKINFDDFFQKWQNEFKDRQDFCRFFGVIDPIREGSFQEELAKAYEVPLIVEYEVNFEVEPFEQDIFLIQENKKYSRLLIDTSVLPIGELYPGGIDSQWIDFSLSLLQRFNQNNVGQSFILKQIIRTLYEWQNTNKMVVMKDGKLKVDN